MIIRNWIRVGHSRYCISGPPRTCLHEDGVWSSG